MNFNSFEFLLIILPITLVIYWLLRSRGKVTVAQWVMVAATLIWYGVSFWETSPPALPILVVSLAINFLILKKVLSRRKSGNNETERVNPNGMREADEAVTDAGKTASILLAVGVVFNISLICISRFFVSIPGVSFYSFSAIAVLVEAYRMTVSEVSAGEYIFFMTFFPKMMQGPIAVPEDTLFKGTGRDRINSETVFRAIILFSMGLFKKVIVADMFGSVVAYAYSDLQHIHTGEALIVIFSYAVQLYCDFSGYCDMGMAVANLFGYELPLNFDSPYQASNICDFWRRWHISLTRFFTKYLYIPLGGNRKGKPRMYLNFLIIYLVSGLWHGFNLTYIVWGMSQGVMFVITRLILEAVKKRKNASAATNTPTWRHFGGRLLHILGIAFNFTYFALSIVIFRASSLSEAGRMFQSLGECWFPRLNVTLANCFNIDEFWYIIKVLHIDSWEYGIYIIPVIVLVATFIFLFLMPNAVRFSRKCRLGVPVMLLAAVLLIWSVVSFNGVATYIYVNF